MKIASLTTRLPQPGWFLDLKLLYVHSRKSYTLVEKITTEWRDSHNEVRYYKSDSLEGILDSYKKGYKERREGPESSLLYVFEVVRKAAVKQKKLGLSVGQNMIILDDPELLGLWDYPADYPASAGELSLYKYKRGYAVQYISFNRFRSHPEVYELDSYTGSASASLEKLMATVEDPRLKKNILEYMSENR